MPDFETFQKAHLPHAAPPTVTIQRRGAITINGGAYAMLGEPSAVELLYDRQTSVLGLRAVEPSAAHACFVRRAYKSAAGPWVISAMAFVKHFGIDVRQSRRRPAWRDGATLCVDLSLPGVVVSRVRKTVLRSVQRHSGRRDPGRRGT